MGQKVVVPKDLQPAPTESLYPAANGALYRQQYDGKEAELRCVKW